MNIGQWLGKWAGDWFGTVGERDPGTITGRTTIRITGRAALTNGGEQPDLIQHPGLTSSTWTLINAPIRRPIENDEALLLAMNMI
jgi:hypothetical protein